MIGWLITGTGMLMLAFVFQSLAQRKPEVDGGVYGYAREGFGRYVGFTSAWGYWISAWIGNVAYLVLLMSTLGYWFSGLEGGTTVTAIVGASVLLWVVHAHTLSGVRNAAFVNVLVTVAKVVPIVTFIAIAAVGFNAGLFTTDFWGENAGLGSTMDQVKNMMLVTVWVFIGIEGAAVYSQRARSRKDVGRATIIGFVGVLALLLAVNLLSYGLMAQADIAGLSDPSMAGLLENKVGAWGAGFISAGLAISLLGALLAWVLLAVEILRLPARDHVLPAVLGKENRHGAPAPALWLTNICVQAMLLWTLVNENACTPTSSTWPRPSSCCPTCGRRPTSSSWRWPGEVMATAGDAVAGARRRGAEPGVRRLARLRRRLGVRARRRAVLHGRHRRVVRVGAQGGPDSPSSPGSRRSWWG